MVVADSLASLFILGRSLEHRIDAIFRSGASAFAAPRRHAYCTEPPRLDAAALELAASQHQLRHN